jgi:hypothetical protein
MKLIKLIAILLGFNNLDFNLFENTTAEDITESKPQIETSDDSNNKWKKTLLIAGGVTLIGFIIIAILSQDGAAQDRADLSVGATKDMLKGILQANKAFIENTNNLITNNDQIVTNKLQFLITQTKRIVNNQAMISKLISMKFGIEKNDGLWSGIKRREKNWGEGNKLNEESQNECDDFDE